MNCQVFKAIMESMDELVAGGLLMPPFLATIKSHKAFRDAIKAELISDKYKGKLRFSSIMRIMYKRMQRARFEQALLTQARSYVGYEIDFPAFIDFRGRAYFSYWYASLP